MLFNSLQFLVFFPAVVAIYFLLPQKRRWMFLLASSYYFYMCWKPEYIVLIAASTLIDYFAGLRMGQESVKSKRRKYLILSICTNFGLLFAFKYFNFFSDSARVILQQFNVLYDTPVLNVLLPVGISFYTFQTLSYSISVYRGVHPPERHLGIFALYVSFFPQLVAGPIERSENLLPQFTRTHRFEYERVRAGLQLAAWGLFKKVVIADRAAIIVNTVYNQADEFSAAQLVVATIFFAFQIYCDFSGYSDIAIGIAQVLGYDLMKNFDRPYYSKSISEFWGRWHISLSTWFRDYLYIPLGGSRVSRARWYFNLSTTFLVSGLWHGANWTFVVWGGLNGLYLIIETFTMKLRLKGLALVGLNERSWFYKFPAVLWTFALTCFAWIFFRANNMDDAFMIARQAPAGVWELLTTVLSFDLVKIELVVRGLGLSQRELVIIVGAIIAMETVHLFQRRPGLRQRLAARPLALRWALYYALIGGILFLGSFNQAQQFIYFQF
jgi:alginate O-acetyltransferase complex protein AlgI